MVKKLLVTGGVMLLATVFVFGKDAFSYLRTGATSVRRAVKAEVPVEFEVQRARQLVEQLVPDIRHCMHVVAEQQVEVEHLTAALDRKEAEMAKQKDAIVTLRTDLGTGKVSFTYASRSYSKPEVQRDLTVRFERFKTAEQSLDADRKILRARETTLTANREKLESLLTSKQELEVKLEQLQARLNSVQAAEAVSQLAIDDSNLSHARRLITDLNKQLDVKEKLLDQTGKFTGVIPVETPVSPVSNSTADLGREIDTYFGLTGSTQPDAMVQSATTPLNK